jgi:high-affinity iron transporter
VVSFIAVYREVFETVLFYEALWLQTAPGGRRALAAGLGAAAVMLALASWLIVRGSLRLPVGLFFGLTSLMLAGLAIVLAGKGVAALQEAAILAPYPISAPRLPLLGIYPDRLGLSLQAALACSSWPDSPGAGGRCVAGADHFVGARRLCNSPSLFA